MMRRALAATAAATVAVGVLVAAPVVASAPTTVTGTPTAAAAVAVRPAALSAAATSAGATPAAATPGPAAHSGAAPGAAGAARAKHHHPLRWLRAHRIALAGVLHAQWTTKTKDGPVVTHDAIHGTVGAVSGGVTSFTVTAADKVSQTYSTSAATKVWTVTTTDGKLHVHRATVAAIAHGADVVVEGTGSSAPYAATRVLVRVAG